MAQIIEEGFAEKEYTTVFYCDDCTASARIVEDDLVLHRSGRRHWEWYRAWFTCPKCGTSKVVDIPRVVKSRLKTKQMARIDAEDAARWKDLPWWKKMLDCFQ